jgi:8-oxo-dGTP pyrophosphatase MutT (NUDIX family)
MQRHFTVTGFVTQDGRTALHWHRLGRWLPPGGHIEPDEDPLQAVLREVREELGLDVEVIDGDPPFAYTHPRQLPVPAAMAVYNLQNGDRTVREHHQHIDLVYFTRPLVADAPGAASHDEFSWVWVDEPTLRRNAVLIDERSGAAAAVPEDVRELAFAAIAAERRAPARAGG